MDEYFRQALIDYFTGPELVDLLDTPVGELVDLLSEQIEENEEKLREYINFGE
jgi:hypothetical protein